MKKYILNREDYITPFLSLLIGHVFYITFYKDSQHLMMTPCMYLGASIFFVASFLVGFTLLFSDKKKDVTLFRRLRNLLLSFSFACLLAAISFTAIESILLT